MNNTLFVSGRICLFGEHSDYLSSMGKAITYSTDLGIYSKGKKFKNIIIKNNGILLFKEDKVSPIDLTNKLNDIIYILAAINTMIKNYNVGGIEIDIIKNTLPMAKSLSSSSAIVLTVIKWYNKLYNLNISSAKEEKLGMESEQSIDSNCGIMDFKSIVSYFDKTDLNAGIHKLLISNFNNITSNNNYISLKNDITFIIVELAGTKNTRNILKTLLNYKNNYIIENFFSHKNKDIISQAIASINSNNMKDLGLLMTEVQIFYNQHIYPLLDSEFQSKVVNEILNDDFIKDMTYGGKNTGSHGLGSIILIPKENIDINSLISYIEDKFNLNVYINTLKKEA